MEMKMIVRDQSKNYFHLTPKIGPLWGVGGGVCVVGSKNYPLCLNPIFDFLNMTFKHKLYINIIKF